MRLIKQSSRNRHLAEWRFLLFTIIVTVNRPICSVIRMGLTPFREVWLTACRCAAPVDRIAQQSTESKRNRPRYSQYRRRP
nr:MAG TPA: hypothetical protein [Bacteriophage sp.]